MPRELIYSVWVHLWRGDVDAATRLRDRLDFLLERTNPGYDDLSRAAERGAAAGGGGQRRGARHRPACDRGRAAAPPTTSSSAAGSSARRVMRRSPSATWPSSSASSTSSQRGSGAASRRRSTRRSRACGLASPPRWGQHSEVADHARAAIDLFDAMHMPFWVAVARLEHGEWLVARGRTDEAEDYLERAAATFAELGAAPMLARVRATARSSPGRRGHHGGAARLTFPRARRPSTLAPVMCASADRRPRTARWPLTPPSLSKRRRSRSRRWATARCSPSATTGSSSPGW